MTKNPRETTGTKVCKLCGVSKPLTDFAPEPRGADGRRNTCRSCRYQQGKQKKKQYRAENRDRILKQRRDRFNNQRDLTKLLVCSWCAKSFYPLKGSYGQSAMFCSKSCSSRANLHRINRQVGSAAPLTQLPIRVETRYSGTEPVTSTADAIMVVKEKSESWRESGEHWDAVARWFAERQQAEQKAPS